MIACINPSDHYIEETTSTLLYAGRAKNIENVPHVNEDSNAALIRSLRAEIAQLKQELSYYRTMASESVTRATEGVVNPNPMTRVVAPASVVSTNASGETNKHNNNHHGEKLAESLLAACEMLQQILELNGKLREAYDAILEDKEAGEEREVQLNAENTALRERVEFLESIALNNKFIEKVDKSDDDENGETNQAYSGSESEEEEEGPVGKTASNERFQRPSSSPETRSTRLAPVVAVGSVPSSSRGVAGGNASMVPPPLPPPEPRSGKAEKKKPIKKKKKKGKLREKLKDYERKYGSTVGMSYEAYYGDARRAVPQRESTKKAVTEVEALIEKLPKDIVTDFIPKSSLKPKNFGKLDYCGTPEEIQRLEAKKREKENYKQRLLQRQEELRSAIMRDLAISELGGEAFLQQSLTTEEKAAQGLSFGGVNPYTVGSASLLARRRQKASTSSTSVSSTPLPEKSAPSPSTSAKENSE